MNEIDNTKVGNFITSLRKEANLTQEELANKLLVTDKAVSKWESGKGLPDLEFQRKLCKLFNITLEELHEGKRNSLERKRIKKLEKHNKIYRIIIIIFIPILIFLITYFLLNYFGFKIYYVKDFRSDDDQVEINAFFIKKPREIIMFLNSIDLINEKVLDTDMVDFIIYSNDKIIYHSNMLKPDIKIIKSNNFDLDNLRFSLKVYKDEETLSYENILLLSKFKYKIKSNNKKYEEANINILPNDKIVENLKNNGFKMINDNVYGKDEYIFNDKITIHIMLKDNIIEIFIYFDNQIQKIYVDYDVNFYQSIIYNKNDMTNIIEKYTYNFSDDKLDCQIGECTSYEKTYEIVKTYLSLLSVES